MNFSFPVLRQFGSILFFSLLFAVFLWVVSSAWMVNQITKQSYSDTHVAIVFDPQIPTSEYQKIYGNLSFITSKIKPLSMDEAGPLSSKGMDHLDIKGKKILILTLDRGKDQSGKPVSLTQEIASVQKLLSGNQYVLLVEENYAWAQKLDDWNEVLLHFKRSGVFLLGFLLMGMIFFWSLFLRISFIQTDHAEESASFWKQTREDSPRFHREGFRLGLFSGLGACLLVFISHSSLFSEALDPFISTNFGGLHSVWGYWFLSFPVLSGGVGWLSGQVARLLPASSL